MKMRAFWTTLLVLTVLCIVCAAVGLVTSTPPLCGVATCAGGIALGTALDQRKKPEPKLDHIDQWKVDYLATQDLSDVDDDDFVARFEKAFDRYLWPPELEPVTVPDLLPGNMQPAVQLGNSGGGGWITVSHAGGEWETTFWDGPVNVGKSWRMEEIQRPHRNPLYFSWED